MSLMAPDEYGAWMLRAIDDARLALGTDDVPVAALVLDAAGRVIGTGRNERELRQDPTAHAEVLALRAAAEATGDWH
ncbi:MAG: tRNA(adenine34) deaminase, partial [Microbacteriaceae bacterium]|nr:tRNA(adenine34) deaminase [Microbacteriaceae bacterium]